MKFTTDLSVMFGTILILAFAVNIIVQMTKSYIPLPTKLWCVLVAMTVNLGALFGAVSLGTLEISVGYVIFSLVGSFFVAYIAMYGFDTFKELWQRFKDGGSINEDN